MRPSEKRSVITSVRWTEDEFCRLQIFLIHTGRNSLSDLVREATLAQLKAVLQPYDKNEESNNERKERTKEKKETTKNVCLADSVIGDEAEASTHHKKEKSLAERRQAFWNRLVPFIKKGIYTREMVTAFYLYWTESNENGKKMRFEMEKTYELPRRLATWHNRDFKATRPDQLRAKHLREQQSADYLRHQEEAQQHAISYAEYKKGL